MSEGRSARKVLLCLHHRLERDLGAPAVTLELGEALERAGCEVAFYSFDDAFRGGDGGGVARQLRFPWHVAAHLARRAQAYDVVDASTGDAWVWASLGRPRGSGTALVTRSHGLEHIAVEQTRRLAERGGPSLSWKYPLYHGGLRLWEVRRSLRLSDRCVLLNGPDRDYVRDRLGVPGHRLAVIPNGIAETFHETPAPSPVEGPVRLAFVGGWSIRKGKETLVTAVAELERQGLDFSLTLLGTGVPEPGVLGELPGELRSRISVVPAFANERLPELLVGHELLLFPSLSEGSSGALLEAMACGLAPVATAVGAAEEILDDSSGVLVPPGDADAIAAAAGRLCRDRDALFEMRRQAQQTARRFRWEAVAMRTIELYDSAIDSRAVAGRQGGRQSLRGYGQRS
ncbi:MAG TPA: glycosyltransferase family 4 protein [Thermoleophilaceae bacterium]